MVGSGCCLHWSTVLAVFQPPSSQSTLSGWLMRSEANLLLSECQPRPRLGSSPARATPPKPCAACAFAALLRRRNGRLDRAKRGPLSGEGRRAGPGANLAARHRCDIPAFGRPCSRRTPYIGLTESTCDGEQRTLMNSLPERIMEWHRGNADTGGGPPAPRRPGGRGPGAIPTRPFGATPAGRPHASDPEPVQPSRSESGAGPSSGRSDGCVPARSKGVWMSCWRSSRSARVRIPHRTVGRFQQTPKRSESPRWR